MPDNHHDLERENDRLIRKCNAQLDYIHSQQKAIESKDEELQRLKSNMTEPNSGRERYIRHLDEYNILFYQVVSEAIKNQSFLESSGSFCMISWNVITGYIELFSYPAEEIIKTWADMRLLLRDEKGNTHFSEKGKNIKYLRIDKAAVEQVKEFMPYD